MAMTSDLVSATIVARARDKSPNGYVLTFILPDGRKIDLWHQYKSEATSTGEASK